MPPTMRSLLVTLAMFIPSLAFAEAAPIVLATCDEGSLELVTTAHGAELRGKLTAPDGNGWSFTSHVAVARVGRRARTVAVEQVASRDGTHPAKGSSGTPSQLWIDLFLD